MGYWKILGRPPDEDGKAHFLSIANGSAEQPWPLSIAQIVDELITSHEFEVHSEKVATEEHISDYNVVVARAEAYTEVLKHFKVDAPSVTHLYIKILGRYPDDNAKQYYESVVADA